MRAKEKMENQDELIPRMGVEGAEEETEEFSEKIKINNGSNDTEFTLEDLPGVGPATVEKLETAGFCDLMSLAVATPGELIEATGMNEASAKKVINAARANLKMGFQSGEDIMKKRLQVVKISTGSEAFNTLMGGGFESGSITECFGEFGSGKTQIGHMLVVNMIKENPEAVAVYIDTENTFRPERIKQLAEGAGLDFDQVLKQIKVARAYNSDHQMLLAEKVEDLIKKDKQNVRLLVVDSLMAHFRAEFIGRGTLAERQQKINKHMHVLLRLADTNNLAVYVTNQVSSDPAQFFGDPTKPVGGNIVAHASTFRIYLRKGKKGSRVAKLIDSPNLPDGEVAFFVETTGLKDFGKY